MRFRTTLLLCIAGLIAAMSTVVVTAIKVVLDRSAQRDVRQQLRRTQDVFVEMNGYRRSQLSAGARMLADEPRLMALLATVDISPITIRGVARDLSRALATERFLVADATGEVKVDLGADAPTSEPRKRSVQADTIVERALDVGSASGMWIQGQELYQVLAQRIGREDAPLGVVVIGYRFDERMTESVFRLTGSAVLMELDGQIMASTALEASGISLTATRGASAVPADADEPVELTLGNSKYLASAAHFEGTDRDPRLRYIVLHSLDQALAPGRKLQRVAYIAVGLALPLSFLIAVYISRRLSRPIDGLVRVTERIGRGDLKARAEIRGAVEMRALSEAVNDMAVSLNESRVELAAKQRIEQEMAIAARIQTAILPPAPLSAPALEVAAHMIPATEVGGDYYDVLPDESHCWLAIGDVAGHGVPAGMIMMMVQNVIASMTRARPEATPSDIFCRVNRILVDHVRHRMNRDDHVTLTLLRHDGAGTLTFAGAHEEILVWRADSGTCERIETPGTWLAVMADIDEFITDQTLTLAAGDTVVLYTDGITEAMNLDGQQFGIDRLCRAIETHHEKSADGLCLAVIDEVMSYAHVQNDDVTIMAVRYRPAETKASGERAGSLETPVEA